MSARGAYIRRDPHPVAVLGLRCLNCGEVRPELGKARRLCNRCIERKAWRASVVFGVIRGSKGDE